MRISIKVFTIVALLVFSTTSFAGLGIHVGMDLQGVDAVTENFTFENDPAGTPLSSLNREESSKPLNIGVDLTFNMLPILDFQLSVEAAFGSYDVRFDSGLPSGTHVQEEVPYLRMGADLSVLYEVFSFPPVVGVIRPFIGGGLSVNAFGPVFGQDLLKDKIKSADEEVKPEDMIEAEAKLGFHIMAGTRIKPGPLPFGFRLTAKYYIFTDQAPDTPDSFMTVQAGIYIGG